MGANSSDFHTIHYLWNFKPDEKNTFPYDVVDNNGYFVDNYVIHGPTFDTSLNIRRCTATVFSDFAEIYDKIPHWVVKCDLVRLLIVYFHGGIYSDVDCFMVKQWDQHRKRDNILLFTEHVVESTDLLGKRECKNKENVVRIANYCFGSKNKHHPFLKEVIDECLHRLRQLLIVEKIVRFGTAEILYVCGPDVITTVYHRSRDKYDDVFLYDTTYLHHKYYSSWW